MSRQLKISIGTSCRRQLSEHLLHFPLESEVTIKKFSPTTNVLVASSVTDRDYRNAVSLGIAIVSVKFLESLHNSLHDENFTIDSFSLDEYKLPKFQGLVIFLAGFAEVQQMTYLIQANGGKVTYHPERATHVVVEDGNLFTPLNDTQLCVNPRWLAESCVLGWCANERNFKVEGPVSRLQRRDATRRLPDRVKKPPGSIRRILTGKNNKTGMQKYKRYNLARELYENEVNTLRTLDLLIRVKRENRYLTEHQGELIFGNFPALHIVHSRIVEKLGKVVLDWTDDSVVGNIFIEEMDIIEKAYIPYLFGLEVAQEALKECRKTNLKFKTYVEEKERSHMFAKNKLDYLLVAPYQELTSRLNVLIKEILKYTDDSMSDYQPLNSAVDGIAQILNKANEFKKRNVNNEKIYKQIYGLPAFVPSTGRLFISKMSLYSLGGTGEWCNLARYLLNAYLFDDILIVTRSMDRSMSCVNLASINQKTTSKDQRYEKHIVVHQIRQMLEVLTQDQNPVYVITIRGEFGDDEWLWEGQESVDEARQFAQSIIQEVNASAPERNFALERVNYNQLEDERKEHLRRLASFRGFNTSVLSDAENSPLKKLRSYSQRLRLRGKENTVVKRAQTAPANYNTSSNYLRQSQSVTMLASNSSSSNNAARLREQSIPREERSNTTRSLYIANQSGTHMSPDTSTSTEGETEERMDPYSQVRYFSPLRNLNKGRPINTIIN